ncbi:Phage protein U [Gallibacterium anatis]|uniref:Phage protein U n=1 Tax=Gallibacterium anatis TaxID=750 RepID=A0A377H6T9_9PAST|nr:phage tail protein [Gallibacterium anatis]KGQ56566.1 tail protein [Gallibacterium anatis DSM 16844 = F 149]STO38179.1 Phage protein U [Gallibacterium anatis]
MSYALLGHIAFDLLNAPTALDEKHSATYAQHDVLSGRPRLQAIGNELTELTLNLNLHYMLGSVDGRYQELILAKENQQALALVIGFNQFKGYFVIVDIQSQALYSDALGNTLAREVSVTLREFVGEQGQDILGLALQFGANSPIGALLPAGAVKAINQTKTLVTKGVQLYQQTKRVINDVRNATTLIKTLAADPASALAQLPAVIERVGGALTPLGEMLGLSDSFKLLTQGISGTTYFMRDIAEIADNLNVFESAFKQGLNDSELSEWFDVGVKALDNCDAVLERLGEPVTQMTAWIVLREDNNEVRDE